MKRMYIVMTVLAVIVAMAAPASAAKPDDCPGNSCNEDLSGPGHTCAEIEAVGFDHVVPEWTGDNMFEVVLNNRLGACVDVTAAEGPWEIEVVQVGSARGVYLAVQDSVLPGDTCWGSGDTGEITDPIWFDPYLPESTVDACGLGEADGDPQLTFHANYKGGKLAQPVIITVTLP